MNGPTNTCPAGGQIHSDAGVADVVPGQLMGRMAKSGDLGEGFYFARLFQNQDFVVPFAVGCIGFGAFDY